MVSAPYNPIHLLCIHVSPVYAYETICEKKYEIVECIIMYGAIQKSYRGSSQRSEIKFPYLFTYSLLAGDSHDEAKKFLLSLIFASP